MSPLRRPFVALALAASLPTLIAVAGAIYMYLHNVADQVKAAAMERSKTIMTRVDATVNADISALNVLANSTLSQTQDWYRFYEAALRLKHTHPDWTTIRLFDLRNSQELLDLRRPFDVPRKLKVSEAQLEAWRANPRPQVSDVLRDPQPVIYFYQPLLNGESVNYIIALGVDPRTYQRLVLANADASATTGIVDSQGFFIARNIDHPKRIGTAAKNELRRAIQQGSMGTFSGTTWEGMRNYTAFYKSSLTGWSTHTAVPVSSLDMLTLWSYVLIGMAGVGAVFIGGVLLRLVLIDLESRRNNEEALRQAQKMEAVGRLTGGIAHDFNNLLTPLIGNLDLIRRQLPPDDRLRRLADNALEAARRGARLSSRLLAFSRKQKLQLRPVNLRELLAGINMLIEHSLGPRIQLRVDISDEANLVSTDPNQLELALLNLVANARDAMPDGGTLLLSSQLVLHTMPHQSEARFAEIQVADEGIGMTETVRARAIEPFFTTKKEGQGTGLGLAQVYGIVRESGGDVRIASEPGRGTTVFLYLPIADAPRASMPMTVPLPRAEETTDAAARSQVLLVVDDNADISRFVAAALDSEYRVLTAANGPIALELASRQRIDVLVIDFMMAPMNGAEVASRLRAQQPGIRIVLISGHADSAAIAAMLGEVEFLPKPFDVEQLRSAIHGARDWRVAHTVLQRASE